MLTVNTNRGQKSVLIISVNISDFCLQIEGLNHRADRKVKDYPLEKQKHLHSHLVEKQEATRAQGKIDNYLYH